MMSVVYDEDSPELTDDMEKAFIAAGKSKPYPGEPLTLYVSSATDYLTKQSSLKFFRASQK